MPLEHVPEEVHWRIHHRTSAAASKRAPAAVCILGFLKNQRPSGIGSGVLIRVPPYFFLVTAAHVVTEGPQELYLEVDGKALPLVEKFCLIEKSPDDWWEPDIAFAGLSALTVSAIGVGRFLMPSDLGGFGGADRGRYALIIGYPSSRARANPHTDSIHPEMLPYSTRVLPVEQLQLTGRDPSYHFALEFDQDMSVLKAELTSAPRPIGMSGAPVFGLNSLLDEHQQDPVVGIATTWRREDPKCIIATDIAFVLAAILRAFPECQQLLDSAPSQTSVWGRFVSRALRLLRVSG